MNRELSTSTDWPVTAMPKTWIESLFERMLFAYGKKFSDQWGGAEPEGLKLYWAERLGDLKPEEMRRGVAALESRDWPPTLPEFKKMCRPEVDNMVAYYEAVNGVTAREQGAMGEWSHPAIYWASSRMAFDLKSLTYSAIKDRWNKALAEEMAKGEWAAIPQPMVALPAPGKSELSKEKAAQMLQEIGAGEVLKTAASKTDHKLWAKRIKERERQGDKTLTMIQKNFANMALAARAE